MAGNDPLVAEYNARDAVKAGVLWVDKTFGVQEFRTSGGLIPTGGTVPLVVVSGSNWLRWAAAATTPITWTIDIPGDYNEVIDKAHMRLKLFKSTGGNVGSTATLSYNIVRDGVAIPGSLTDLTAVAISDATTPSIWDTSCSTLGLKGKDSVTFQFAPTAHDTCVIDLFGGCFRYIGGTSLYNQTDREAT